MTRIATGETLIYLEISAEQMHESDEYKRTIKY